MPAIDPAELGRLFEANGAKLVLYARQWLGAGPAEDVVQDVFIRLMSQRRTPANERAWLFRAVRNAAISQIRWQSRRNKYEQHLVADQSGWFAGRADDPIDAEAVRKALGSLTDDQREVVVLRIWGGLTLHEVADVVARPISTVFSRYRSALAQLRRKLERYHAK